jgi:hypothetical protein
MKQSAPSRVQAFQARHVEDLDTPAARRALTAHYRRLGCSVGVIRGYEGLRILGHLIRLILRILEKSKEKSARHSLAGNANLLETSLIRASHY